MWHGVCQITCNYSRSICLITMSTYSRWCRSETAKSHNQNESFCKYNLFKKIWKVYGENVPLTTLKLVGPGPSQYGVCKSSTELTISPYLPVTSLSWCVFTVVYSRRHRVHSPALGWLPRKAWRFRVMLAVMGSWSGITGAKLWAGVWGRGNTFVQNGKDRGWSGCR